MALWWIGNAILLLVVAPVVVLLFNRVIRVATEISAYADDILAHGNGIAANLEPVPALLDTRDLVRDATGHAVRYVGAIEPLTRGGR